MADVPFTLWLECEAWVPKPDDDPYDDFMNMTVTLADGRIYALNVWTFKFLERARRECEAEGDNLGGKYLLPPDLFVEKLDRGLLEQVVADLLATEELKNEWLVPPQHPDDEKSDVEHFGLTFSGNEAE